MVGFVSDSFPWMEGRLACLGGSRRQIADTDIDADDFVQVCGSWRGEIDGQGNEQIELLLWPIIPQFCVPDARPMPNGRKMLIIALVGDGDTSVKRTYTDPAGALKGVIPLVSILGSR